MRAYFLRPPTPAPLFDLQGYQNMEAWMMYHASMDFCARPVGPPNQPMMYFRVIRMPRGPWSLWHCIS
jgi:hypothetical protein